MEKNYIVCVLRVWLIIVDPSILIGTYSAPEITLQNEDHYANGTSSLNISCSAPVFQVIVAVSLRCSNERENFTKYEGPVVTGIVYLMFQIQLPRDNFVDCSCSATYYADNKKPQQTASKRVFMEKFYSRPEIILLNTEYDTQGTYLNVSCSVPRRPLVVALSIRCGNATENVNILEGSVDNRIIYLAVKLPLARDSFVDCSCNASYISYKEQKSQQTAYKRLFVENVTSEYPFNLSSNNVSTYNHYANENQSVTFTCIPTGWSRRSPSLHNESMFGVLNPNSTFDNGENEEIDGNGLFKFSHIFASESVQCGDSTQYQCLAFTSRGDNYTSKTLLVRCGTDNCTETDECDVNGTIFPSMCTSRITWNTEYCPLSCSLCSTGRRQSQRETVTSSVHLVAIVVSALGTVIVGAVVGVALKNVRDCRIRRNDGLPDLRNQEPNAQSTNASSQRDSNRHIYCEINENRHSPSNEKDGNDYIHPVYVAWQLPDENYEGPRRLSMLLDRSSPKTENEHISQPVEPCSVFEIL